MNKALTTTCLQEKEKEKGKEEMRCIICNDEFEINPKPGLAHSRNKKIKRPFGSKTCSPKCSKRYLYEVLKK